MSLVESLHQRANHQCELTAQSGELATFVVSPKGGENLDECVLVQTQLLGQLQGEETIQPNDWHGLRESIWSEVPAVQVVAYRLLKQLAIEAAWAQDLLETVYLDETTLTWAEQTAGAAVVHKDSNGHLLEAGDTVVLVKDLKVKGANFTAKRGTAVRRISLVADNAEHIEGKVEGQRIVILTQYVKKSNK
ncbi:MAG: PhnA domain-containing protein [Bacteroidota bacterium]